MLFNKNKDIKLIINLSKYEIIESKALENIAKKRVDFLGKYYYSFDFGINKFDNVDKYRSKLYLRVKYKEDNKTKVTPLGYIKDSKLIKGEFEDDRNVDASISVNDILYYITDIHSISVNNIYYHYIHFITDNEEGFLVFENKSEFNTKDINRLNDYIFKRFFKIK